MPLYHAQRRSPGKSVMHHAIIDTDNRLGLLRSRDVFARHNVVVAEMTDAGPNVAAVEDAAAWTVVREIADDAGARARLPRALTRGPYDAVRNNCEHFATEVATGDRHSPQVRAIVALACGTFLLWVLSSD